LGILRHLQTRGHDQCATLKVDKRAHREMEGTLRRYITHLLERGLKSADLLDALRKEQEKPAASALRPG
jgi:hypothetical protein